MDAGLQGDGTKGGTKNGADVVEEPSTVMASGDGRRVPRPEADTTAVLVTELGALLRCLVRAGYRALPVRIRADLEALLARAADNGENN
ncbi:MAG: hypothetical protein JNK15_05215 [Planctomycetes bacterium]|nr:hypothetical protein [Planctomycetota bacterium]